MVGKLTEWDFRDRLAQITLPTLLTVGEFDTMPLDAVRRMHKTLKNSRMVVTPDGGHCHHIDNPKAFFLLYISSSVMLKLENLPKIMSRENNKTTTIVTVFCLKSTQLKLLCEIRVSQKSSTGTFLVPKALI